MAHFTVAVEGAADVAVAAAILRECGHQVVGVHGLRGKGHLDQKVHAFVAAARHSPWLILRDLDQDAACAPSLLGKLGLPRSGPVRVAVRAVEAWLLADRRAVADWLRGPVGKVPGDVEALVDPKQDLVNLARKSASRLVREDVVPRGTARTGPGYVDQIRRFCDSGWRVRRAAAACPSLQRCVGFVER